MPLQQEVEHHVATVTSGDPAQKHSLTLRTYRQETYRPLNEVGLYNKTVSMHNIPKGARSRAVQQSLSTYNYYLWGYESCWGRLIQIAQMKAPWLVDCAINDVRNEKEMVDKAEEELYEMLELAKDFGYKEWDKWDNIKFSKRLTRKM